MATPIRSNATREPHIVARKLTTSSRYDIQFNDLDVPYYFGFATFDNAEVQHTLHKGTVVLRFVK